MLLVAGGEILVSSAVQLARRLDVSAFVIGAVVIGFGSSLPELVTSIEAGLLGAPVIALGNIIGSNIINTLVVIGLAAVITPIAVSAANLRIDTTIVCAMTVAFVAICTMLELTPAIGALLLVGLAAYLIFSVRREAEISDGDENANLDDKSEMSTATAIAVTVFGLILLIGGGHFVVDGSVTLAKLSGISEAVIGLTIVAFGTSLPEIVTAFIAAIRRHADVALGNVLGSCMFNLLAIGGAIAIVAPSAVPPEIVWFDNLVMLAATAALLVTAWILPRIDRSVGALFLGSYAAYLMVVWQ